MRRIRIDEEVLIDEEGLDRCVEEGGNEERVNEEGLDR